MARTDAFSNTLKRIDARHPLLLVLSGPSGVGKDAVLESLKGRLKIPFFHITTATTRKKRPDESDGLHYIFISRSQFQEKIGKGELLEWAKVYDNYYGVPREQVKKALSAYRLVIIKVDVQGALAIKSQIPDAVYIFLTPSSKGELSHRLLKRGNMTAEELKIRLEKAEEELAALPDFDYVVENKEDNLNYSVSRILSIIDAELCKVSDRIISL
jgi:guanylate kinase